MSRGDAPGDARSGVDRDVRTSRAAPDDAGASRPGRDRAGRLDAAPGAVLFSDLDRTLIHPQRTAAEHGLHGADARVVEVYEGRGITTMSERSLALLGELAAEDRFVPVTTRSREQLRRIEAVFALVADGWAVCANGAYVLHRGGVDADWERALRGRLRGAARPAEVQVRLDQRFGPADEGSWLLRWRDCEQRFLYAICDLDRTPAAVQDEARDLLAPLGWTAYLHARKLYALPTAITKEAAAAHVLDRLAGGGAPPSTVGAGDSAMDLGLVGWADAGWVPGCAEVVAQGLPLPPGTAIGEGRHNRAAEELLAAATRAGERPRVPSRS